MNISPIFYQSWDKELPEKIVSQNIQYVPEHFIYRRFSLKEIRQYLKNNWPQEIVRRFDRYKLIQHKIDLWRYCILYDTGGIYMDADCLLTDSISGIINNSDCFFVTNNRGIKSIFNGFLGTFPQNPIYKEIIEFTIKVKRTRKLDYYFSCNELYKILNSYININLEQFQYVASNTMTGSDIKVSLLIDRELEDGRYYAFFYRNKILMETNSAYPY